MRILAILIGGILGAGTGVGVSGVGNGTLFVGQHQSGPVDAGPHEHCWHPMGWTHAIGLSHGCSHLDGYCCHCGKKQCETKCYTTPNPLCEGHGPFLPGCEHPDGGN